MKYVLILFFVLFCFGQNQEALAEYAGSCKIDYGDACGFELSGRKAYAKTSVGNKKVEFKVRVTWVTTDHSTGDYFQDYVLSGGEEKYIGCTEGPLVGSKSNRYSVAKCKTFKVPFSPLPAGE
ncbi:MAG: hypothetical protein R8K46_00005 [Mariprofundaceae bacterium]